VLATWLAGEVAQRFGWRASFYVAALCLFGVGLAVLGFLPSRATAPSEAPGSEGAVAERSGEQARLRAERSEAQWQVVKSPRIWLYGTSYFFIKLIRYALLSWLPYYLSHRFGYGTGDAARFSTAFDAGGAVGVVLIGMLSDRLPWRGRAAWALVWLGGLVLSLVAYVAVGEASLLYNTLLLALVGALLFGPDALISGAAAQDAGGPLAPALATGFVNGLGSAGALLQGLLVPAIVDRFGWSALFPVFVACSACAALALLPALRSPAARKRGSTGRRRLGR
jgi:sugar phosphate permease